ncbi:MAG: hypothetical protein ACJ76Y_03590 [Thermoanaerobaculia bacterium]
MSWLVRCWEEPSQQPDESPVLRGFVRDLKTGKERYLSDPGALGEIVTQEILEAERTREEEAEKPGPDD